ncbi:MAG: hypothetical protein H6831_02430 [Planctomycetes bacterium]|nr:hypothetical protein [Planctomycetota bacterium]MCB9903239.1 hypothetical protein [Planctomycetota bacterium]
MITAVLAALTLTAAPVEAPAEELVLVRVEPTRLVARNLGDEDRLLLFASADRTKFVGRRLRAGESLRLDFPRRALDGAWLEVLDTVGDEWTTTGALRLSTGELDCSWTMFCSPPEAQGQIHGPTGEARRVLEAAPSLLPAKAQPFFGDGAALRAEHAAPTHVPGPKPTPPTPDDDPPELEKDPLPPL